MEAHLKSLRLKQQTPSLSEREAVAALRAEVQIELKNKKQCSYQSYECSQLSLDGYSYCLKHILSDKTAPFKQCSYLYTSNSKRCPLPAPKCDKKDAGYCNEHALKATLLRNRQNCKYPAPHTAEVLLHSLSHYVKKPRLKVHPASAAISQDEGKPSEEADMKATKSLDPFTEIDVPYQLNPSGTDCLDVCSDSESDLDASVFGTVWHDAQADSSDNESIDSEQEDYLKHANVYTAEEVTVVTREKLIRLQSLYIEQYRHLQYVLKECRRKYLHALRREKETCCNIYNQVRDNPREQKLYKKLKAYNKYHRTHGVKAVLSKLSKRSRDLKAKITEGINPKSGNFSKCLFTEGGVKCSERTLPLSRHCRKHILEDPHQILFRPCGKRRADVECTTPVEAIFDNTTCNLHMDIPRLRSYSQARKDSDSEYDETLEAANLQNSLADLSTTCNMKTELIDFNMPPELPKMETVPTQLFEETLNTSETKIKCEAMEQDVFGSGIRHEETAVDATEKFTILPRIRDSTPVKSSDQTENAAEQTDLLKITTHHTRFQETDQNQVEKVAKVTKEEEEIKVANRVDEVTNEGSVLTSETVEDQNMDIDIKTNPEIDDFNRIIKEEKPDTGDEIVKLDNETSIKMEIEEEFSNLNESENIGDPDGEAKDNNYRE